MGYNVLFQSSTAETHASDNMMEKSLFCLKCFLLEYKMQLTHYVKVNKISNGVIHEAEQRIFVVVHLNTWKKKRKNNFRLDFFFLRKENKWNIFGFGVDSILFEQTHFLFLFLCHKERRVIPKKKNNFDLGLGNLLKSAYWLLKQRAILRNKSITV